MVARLKSLRERANVSQRALAEHLGISQQSINKYENHGIEPDIETLIQIAEYFNVSVDYLIGHSETSLLAEPVSNIQLSVSELKLINSYRKLDPNERQSILYVIDNYLKK